MVCKLCSAAAACPPLVQLLAVIGVIVLYACIGYWSYLVVRKISDSEELSLLSAVFWPLAIFFGGILAVGYWLLFPFFGATKADLKESEARILESVSTNKVVTKKAVEKVKPSTKKKLFKVGDIITGVPGNPDNYEHLYEGCKCRVLSSDELGNMRMILLDHKDREAHENVIGKVFKGPARNFTLWKKSKK